MTGPVELDLAAADERQREVGERREVAGRADAPLLGHDRMDAVREQRQESRRRRAGRQPLWPRASVFARSSSIARTISRGNGAPTPAAWLISRFCWSRPACAGGDERGGEVAEPGRHAVDDGALGDERLDDVPRLLHPLARVDVEGGRWRRAARPPRRRRRSGRRRSGRPATRGPSSAARHGPGRSAGRSGQSRFRG